MLKKYNFNIVNNNFLLCNNIILSCTHKYLNVFYIGLLSFLLLFIYTDLYLHVTARIQHNNSRPRTVGEIHQRWQHCFAISK